MVRPKFNSWPKMNRIWVLFTHIQVLLLDIRIHTLRIWFTGNIIQWRHIWDFVHDETICRSPGRSLPWNYKVWGRPLTRSDDDHRKSVSELSHSPRLSEARHNWSYCRGQRIRKFSETLSLTCVQGYCTKRTRKVVIAHLIPGIFPIHLKAWSLYLKCN